MRFLATAFPIFFVIVKPNRAPWLWSASVSLTPDPERSGTPSRNRASNANEAAPHRAPPRTRRKSERFLRVAMGGSRRARAKTHRIRQTVSSGPSHGDEQEREHHLLWPYACESHGAVCVQAGWVDMYVSRQVSKFTWLPNANRREAGNRQHQRARSKKSGAKPVSCRDSISEVRDRAYKRAIG